MKNILKKSFVVLTIVVLSYITTSLSFWLVENRMSIFGRIFLYYTHKNYVEGNGPAPNQYRYLPYLLVDKLFKYIPVPWLDDSYNMIKTWAGYGSKEENFVRKRNLDTFFPEADRIKMAQDLEGYLREQVYSLTKNGVTANIVMMFLNQVGWKTWITDPLNFLDSLKDIIPYEFAAVFQSNSDMTKVINGYATYRFAFTVLSFFLLYLWLRYFADEFTSVMFLFVFSSLMPFTMMNFYQQETMLSLALFLGVLNIAVRKKSWAWVFLIVLIGSFARSDHMLFAALVFVLQDVFSHKDKKSLLRGAVLLGTPLIITFLITKVIFADSEYYCRVIQLTCNLTNPWCWFFPVVFLILPAIFVKKAREIQFFKRTFWWIFPFIALNVTVGVTKEVRLFLPLLVYLLPLMAVESKKLFSEKDGV